MIKKVIGLSFIAGLFIGCVDPIMQQTINNVPKIPDYKQKRVSQLEKINNFYELIKDYPIKQYPIVNKDGNFVLKINCKTISNYYGLKGKNSLCSAINDNGTLLCREDEARDKIYNKISIENEKRARELERFCILKGGNIKPSQEINIYGREYKGFNICLLNNKPYYAYKLYISTIGNRISKFLGSYEGYGYFKSKKCSGAYKELDIITPLAFYPRYKSLTIILNKMHLQKNKEGYYLLPIDKKYKLYNFLLGHFFIGNSMTTSQPEQYYLLNGKYILIEEYYLNQYCNSNYLNKNSIDYNTYLWQDFAKKLNLFNKITGLNLNLSSSMGDYLIFNLYTKNLAGIIKRGKKYFYIRPATKREKEIFKNVFKDCSLVRKQKIKEDIKY